MTNRGKVLAICPMCGEEHLVQPADANHQFRWKGNVVPRFICLKCKNLERNRSTGIIYGYNYEKKRQPNEALWERRGMTKSEWDKVRKRLSKLEITIKKGEEYLERKQRRESKSKRKN